MGDNRIVEIDKNDGEAKMSAALIGHNGTPPDKPVTQETYEMLDALVSRKHRGRHDTWGAALDRTARKIGLKPSYAHRIWHRWETMDDVKGSAYRAIRNAHKQYIETCERVEADAADYRQERRRLEHGDTTYARPSPTILGKMEAGESTAKGNSESQGITGGDEAP